MNRKLYIQATPEQELLFCFSEMEILSPNNCGRKFWDSHNEGYYLIFEQAVNRKPHRIND